MTSAEAVSSIYDSAKKDGLIVSNIKLSDRRNKRGYYTYIEVTYVAPGEPNEATLSVDSCRGRLETPEDDIREKFKTIMKETR